MADFNIGPYDSPVGEPTLTGGFSHSPIFFDFNVFQTLEEIDNVSLLVDGQLIESKGSPPYSFEWIPDLAKDYSISAVVKDAVGNVSSTPAKTISVRRFDGSGVNAKFNVPIPESANVGSDLLLSVEAFSEVGVAEVEFFIDMVSVGKVLDQNSSVFSKVVTLKKDTIRDFTMFPLLPEITMVIKLECSTDLLPIFRTGKDRNSIWIQQLTLEFL